MDNREDVNLNDRNKKRSLLDASSSSENPNPVIDRNIFRYCGISTRQRKRQASKADRLLANEMNSLTVEEREAVFEDIHGISKPVKETKIMVENSIQELETELNRIKYKKAYEKARFLSPKYVKNHRLMFLRAKEFEARRAAELMVAYFEEKLQLFGPDKLVELLTMDDLSVDEKESLMTGSAQFLPQRDSAGRLVFFFNAEYRRYRHWKNYLRMVWYLAMKVLMKDEKAQKKGVVCVSYNLGKPKLDSDLLRMSGVLMKAFPIRVVGFHFCLNDPSWYHAASILKVAVGISMRLRFRVHFGSHTECLYKLMDFGIPPRIFPFDPDESQNFTHFQTFLAKLNEEDSSNLYKKASKEVIDYPNDSDVLLGKGKPYQDFPGNVHWSKIMNELLPQYQIADVRKKREVSKKVIDRIKKSGGRFLRRSEDGDSWVVASDDDACEKNCQSFRFRARALDEN